MVLSVIGVLELCKSLLHDGGVVECLLNGLGDMDLHAHCEVSCGGRDEATMGGVGGIARSLGGAHL